MLNSSYQQYHYALFAQLAAKICNTPPFNDTSPEEQEAVFLEKLSSIDQKNFCTDDTLTTGQWLIAKIVSCYPHITPETPRDLFWYFGGECLHFLGDEEIQYFQNIDEAYHDSANNSKDEEVEYATIREKLSGSSPETH